MASCKRWTEEEDKKIVQAVSRKSENLQYCFYLLSKKMDRTPEAISYRWYSALKPYFEAHPEEAPFHLIDKKHVNPGIKNIDRDKQELTKYQVKVKKPFKERFKEALKVLLAK